VTVAERAAPDQALPDFQGQIELAADPYDVLAVILDVPQQTEWMWQCRVSRVLRKAGDGVVAYQVLDAHWPATDRDVVFESQPRVVEPGRRLEVRFESRQDPAVPPVPGLVRMPRLAGEFAIEALDREHARVTYTVSADPGGALPAVILKQTVRESPFDTLVGLRRRVAETHGRYAAVADSWRSRAASPR
jgi:START domain-containing protein